MYTEPIEEVEFGPLTAQFYVDQQPLNPREWDNLATMACFHKRYDLGDEDHDLPDGPALGSLSEMKNVLEDRLGEAYWLPLYLYDHSGLAMNTTGFRHLGMKGLWDSGCVGLIYVSHNTIIGETMWDEIEIEEKAYECMEAEVEEYNNYLQGQVFYYSLQEANGEVIDSCGGLIGWDHAVSYVEAEANRILKKRVKNPAMPM